MIGRSQRRAIRGMIGRSQRRAIRGMIVRSQRREPGDMVASSRQRRGRLECDNPPMILWVLSLVAGSALIFLSYIRLASANPRVLVLRGRKQQQARPKYTYALNLVGFGLVGGGATAVSHHQSANGWQHYAFLVLLIVAALSPALTTGWLHDRRVGNASSRV
jgi:hypothetical protein